MLDDDGEVDSIVVVAHDVTALATAKGEAEAANRLKDEFLATLSHELRTPLNAVLGYTQMLRGGVIGAERMPAVLETIERNAKLQEQLVSDVLDVSRIITGKLRLDFGRSTSPTVIRDALETVAPAAAAKGVRTAVGDRPARRAGGRRRAAAAAGGLEPALERRQVHAARRAASRCGSQRINSHVEIAVSDTGEGIAPEFLPHLFQRFQQADGTFTRRAQRPRSRAWPSAVTWSRRTAAASRPSARERASARRFASSCR